MVNHAHTELWNRFLLSTESLLFVFINLWLVNCWPNYSGTIHFLFKRVPPPYCIIFATQRMCQSKCMSSKMVDFVNRLTTANMERMVSKSGQHCVGWLLQRSRAPALSVSASTLSSSNAHPCPAVPRHLQFHLLQHRSLLLNGLQRLSHGQQWHLASVAVKSFQTSSVQNGADAAGSSYNHFGDKQKLSSKGSYFYCAVLIALFAGVFGMDG